MQLENLVRYTKTLRDPESIKKSSEICKTYRAEGKCECTSQELCQRALAKTLGIKEPTVNSFTNKARKPGLIKVRMIDTRKRPYRFIRLAKEAPIPLL